MKHSDDSQIVFRRIRGRIVPIKTKRAAPEPSKIVAAGKIAAGVGLAVAAGVIAAKFSRAPAYARVFVRKASNALTQAKAAPLFHQRRYKIASMLKPRTELGIYHGILKTGKIAENLKAPAFWAGSIGAGALINSGVDDVLTKEQRKKNSFQRFTAVEMGTMGIVGTAFLRSFPRAPSVAKAFQSAFDIVRKARK